MIFRILLNIRFYLFPKRLWAWAFFFLFSVNGLHSQTHRLYINEFMAVNNHTVKDAQGDYDDWIELYNPGNSVVDIGGMYFSDDADEPLKWQIPSNNSQTLIVAHGFLLLWADGQPAAGPLHLGFKLSGKGEEIVFYEQNAVTLIDAIAFGAQSGDVSFGREPDGSAHWVFFEQATPGASNIHSGFSGKAPPVTFSFLSGLYSDSLHLQIFSQAAPEQIYYTTNSGDPDKTSFIYQGPIPIAKTTIVKARVLIDSLLPGDITSAVYFFNENSHLPVFSLVSDPNNLWGSRGILSNPGAGWERPVHIEYFDSTFRLLFKQNAGIKIHSPGGGPQQSFRIYARSGYGKDVFQYKFFHEKTLSLFKVLILRNGSNDGIQVTNGSQLRDPMMHLLYYRQNRDNDISAYQPANVFLNGAYYGIYNLRERQDAHYLFYNHQVDKNKLDFLERAFNYPNNRNAIEGNWNNYDAMRSFLNDNDLQISEDWDYAQSLLDIRDFTGYWITEIFGGNFDWLTNNQKFWRERTPYSRWKWMLWDMDHALGLPHNYNGYDYGDVNWNTLDWATGTEGPRIWGGSSTLIIRNLLGNSAYKNYFINMFCDLLNTSFKAENTLALFDSLKAQIAPDVPRHLARWTYRSVKDWNRSCNAVRNYLIRRPKIVRGQLRQKFALDTLYTLQVNVKPPYSGTVALNSLALKSFPWQGDYFRNIPVTLKALPGPGFVFNGWQSEFADYNRKEITISPHNTLQIQAVFTPDSLLAPVINEINYKSGPACEAGDWVEIYNPANSSKNLSGWMLKDAKDNDPDHCFTLPKNTTVPAHGFLIFCKDVQKFHEYFPEVQATFGNMKFGLSSNGDQVRLFNSRAETIDQLTYRSSAPWPGSANGEGYTLELTDPFSDNTLAQNWAASRRIGGTPGQANSTLTGMQNHSYSGNPLKSIRLAQNYPNPFNRSTVIDYYVPTIPKSPRRVILTVYNILGQRVKTLVNRNQPAGEYRVIFNGANLAGGVYFYRLKTGKTVLTKKMILIE